MTQVTIADVKRKVAQIWTPFKNIEDIKHEVGVMCLNADEAPSAREVIQAIQDTVKILKTRLAC